MKYRLKTIFWIIHSCVWNQTCIFSSVYSHSLYSMCPFCLIGILFHFSVLCYLKIQNVVQTFCATLSVENVFHSNNICNSFVSQVIAQHALYIFKECFKNKIKTINWLGPAIAMHTESSTMSCMYICMHVCIYLYILFLSWVYFFPKFVFCNNG